MATIWQSIDDYVSGGNDQCNNCDAPPATTPPGGVNGLNSVSNPSISQSKTLIGGSIVFITVGGAIVLFPEVFGASAVVIAVARAAVATGVVLGVVGSAVLGLGANNAGPGVQAPTAPVPR